MAKVVTNIIFLSGCSKKFVVKSVVVNQHLKVIWYNHSEITSNGPDFIEFNSISNGKEQLICEAQAVCDINFKSDTLTILMLGHSIIDLKSDNEYNIKIIIDTTCKSINVYKLWKSVGSRKMQEHIRIKS